MKNRSKYDYVWVLRDCYKSPVSVCQSKRNAKAQLKILAEFEADGRHTTIAHEYDTSIVFENYDSVDMIELPLRNTLNTFCKSFGYGYLRKDKNNKK